eukprot:m.308964 g.308964  ORF g.308964 m.308964 type:complete len:743 (+) comp20197_c1_seq1:246-2474(+)
MERSCSETDMPSRPHFTRFRRKRARFQHLKILYVTVALSWFSFGEALSPLRDTDPQDFQRIRRQRTFVPSSSPTDTPTSAPSAQPTLVARIASDDDLDDLSLSDDDDGEVTYSCTAFSCSFNETCSIRGCVCRAGYRWNSAGEGRCEDNDECASGTHLCTGGFICVNAIGLYHCICPGVISPETGDCILSTTPASTTANDTVGLSNSNPETKTTFATSTGYAVLAVALIVFVLSGLIVFKGFRYLQKFHERENDHLFCDQVSSIGRTETSSISPEALHNAIRTGRQHAESIAPSVGDKSEQSLFWDDADAHGGATHMASNISQNNTTSAPHGTVYETRTINAMFSALTSAEGYLVATRGGGANDSPAGVNESMASVPSVYRMLKSTRDVHGEGTYAHRTPTTTDPTAQELSPIASGLRHAYRAPDDATGRKQHRAIYEQFVLSIQRAAAQIDGESDTSRHSYAKIAGGSLTPSTVGALTRPSSEEHTYTTPEGDHSVTGAIGAHKSPLPPRPLHGTGGAGGVATDSPPRPIAKKPGSAVSTSSHPHVRMVDFGVSPGTPPRPPPKTIGFGDFASNDSATDAVPDAAPDAGSVGIARTATARSPGYAYSTLQQLPPTASTAWNDSVNRKISYSLAMHDVQNATKAAETTTDEMSVVHEEARESTCDQDDAKAHGSDQSPHERPHLVLMRSNTGDSISSELAINIVNPPSLRTDRRNARLNLTSVPSARGRTKLAPKDSHSSYM